MQEPRLPDDEADRLSALYALNILDTPREERFDRITRVLQELFKVPIAYIALVDENRQWFKSMQGLNTKETPRNASFCGHTVLQNNPLIIPDAKKDIRFRDNPLVTGEPNVRYYAGWPISAPNGQNVGTLCMVDRAPRDYPNEKCIRLFRDLAEMAEDQLMLTDLAGIQTSLREARLELERHSTFIREVFGRYMTDELADELLKDPAALALGGRRRMVTVMMTDLRGFTPVSGRLDPEEVIDALNIYFAAMLDITARHGGTIDNIIGDGLMVLFGVPKQAESDACRAVACAIEMQNAMADVNNSLQARGLPELSIGVGINSGEVVVGNVGSDRYAKFSAIGTPVNIAARLESLSLAGQVLITEETLRQADATIDTVGSLRVKAKGVEGHVMIYDVTAIEGESSACLDTRMTGATE